MNTDCLGILLMRLVFFQCLVPFKSNELLSLFSDHDYLSDFECFRSSRTFLALFQRKEDKDTRHKVRTL